MVKNIERLTKTYNRFHDPTEEEARAGANAEEKPKKGAKRGRKRQQDDSGQPPLF